MLEEEIRNVVEMRNRELTFEKDDIKMLPQSMCVSNKKLFLC